MIERGDQRVARGWTGRPSRSAARAATATRRRDDIRLRVVPITAPGRAGPVGAVVVALSTAPLENLQKEVLLGSLVIAALVLLAGASRCAPRSTARWSPSCR